MPRNRITLIAVAIAVVLITAACSSDDSTKASGPAKGRVSDVLRIAYTGDMPDPDPDIFYNTEGNSVVTSVYEDFLQYAPDNSYRLEPALAQSWDESPDGLTYTLHLRPGVKFHTGGTMTSEDAKFAFERRADKRLNAGMAYLTSGIASMDTPDPLTLVIHLSQPSIAFISNLASPYGPKVIDKAAVMAHEVDGDLGQDYLKTHDAGTGPFTLTKVDPGTEVVMTRFDGHWAKAPQLREIDVKIVPDTTTQLLELQNGQLDMIFHGLTPDGLDKLAANPKFQVKAFPATYKLWLNVNTYKGVFKDPALRTALQETIDRTAITTQVYGRYGSPGEDFYIPGEVTAGKAPDDPKYDPIKLAALVKDLPNKTVRLEYTNDDARNEHAAELILAQLQAVGLKVTARGVPLSQGFTYGTADPTTNPDLYLIGGNPDSGNADDYARPLVGTVGVGTNGSLNVLQCSVPGFDDLIDQGLHTTDATASEAAYIEAGDKAVAYACFSPITEIRDVVATRAEYGGIHHQIATVWSIRLADITLDGKG